MTGDAASVEFPTPVLLGDSTVLVRSVATDSNVDAANVVLLTAELLTA
jgi:hypothetical protein